MSALCPGCDEPMVEGQVFNGLYGCHWTCTDEVRKKQGVMKGDPGASAETRRRFMEVRDGIRELEKKNREFAELLDSLSREAQSVLNLATDNGMSWSAVAELQDLINKALAAKS